MKDAHAHALAPVVQARYRQLIKRIQQLPPGGCRPLTVSGRVAGWVTAKATGHLLGLPGVHIEDEAVHITAANGQRMTMNAELTRLEPSLTDTGCFHGCRNDLLDVTGVGRHTGIAWVRVRGGQLVWVTGCE